MLLSPALRSTAPPASAFQSDIVFQDLEKLKARPAHLGVFLRYIFSQADPSPLVSPFLPGAPQAARGQRQTGTKVQVRQEDCTAKRVRASGGAGTEARRAASLLRPLGDGLEWPWPCRRDVPAGGLTRGEGTEVITGVQGVGCPGTGLGTGCLGHFFPAAQLLGRKGMDRRGGCHVPHKAQRLLAFRAGSAAYGSPCCVSEPPARHRHK